MNQTEIFRATQAELNRRMAEIAALHESTKVGAHYAEADLIRRELARRVGCCA